MRTGKTVTKSSAEPHLDNDLWIEVYPDGNVKDLSLIQRIAPEDRTYRNEVACEGQSPLLIRKSAWDRIAA
jgi:hypothetical protein